MMKLISFWSPKGGVGRTTLTLLLASALKNKGFKVLVYDETSEQFALKFAEAGNTDLKILKTGEKISEGELPDLIILDMNAMPFDKAVNIEKSSVVVAPTLPSYPDMSYLNEEVKQAPNKSKFVFCFNKVLSKRKEHAALYTDESFKSWISIKDRALYERLNMEGYDLYNSEVDKWATAEKAREEIDALANKVIEKLQVSK